MSEPTAIVFDVEHFATREGPGIRTAVAPPDYEPRIVAQLARYTGKVGK